MPAPRALNSKYLVFKSILVPIEGTDPVEYVDSYERLEYPTTLDMNSFNSIYQYKDEYGNNVTDLSYVVLNNGETLLLSQNYEELTNMYTSYLNGG
jgi:hypothetical protein